MPEDKKTKIKYLLTKIKENDLFALGELLELKTKDIQTIAYNIIKDKTCIEDVVNEVIISFIQNVNNFSDEQNLNGWLNSVAINKSIDYLRKYKSDLNINNDSDASLLKNPSSEEQIVERISVLDVLSRMNDIERIVLVEKTINKCNYEAISEKYNITYKQVRRIYKTAKESFINYYKK